MGGWSLNLSVSTTPLQELASNARSTRQDNRADFCPCDKIKDAQVMVMTLKMIWEDLPSVCGVKSDLVGLAGHQDPSYLTSGIFVGVFGVMSHCVWCSSWESELTNTERIPKYRRYKKLTQQKVSWTLSHFKNGPQMSTLLLHFKCLFALNQSSELTRPWGGLCSLLFLSLSSKALFKVGMSDNIGPISA